MPYLTCESDYVGRGSKSTNELITCDRTRHASSLMCICILLDMLRRLGLVCTFCVIIPFSHPIDTPQFNPDMPYEFPLQWLHPDTPFHRFYDGPVPHQHPDQPANQADPEPEPMKKHFSEPVSEEDIPVEQISASSSEPSSEEPLTASISGPASAGQTSSTSASARPDIIEIFDDEDKDPEECSDVVVISSDDDT
ncbi:hypothetical protein AHAS_Ahas08G0059300 [Arachis hypogaea]